MKSRLVRAARGTSKLQNWSHFTNSRRRYMAEILPIRRITLSNQSIQNHWAISTKLGTKHPWLNGFQVCSNERPRPFPRRDKYGIAKIHGWNLKKPVFSGERCGQWASCLVLIGYKTDTTPVCREQFSPHSNGFGLSFGLVYIFLACSDTFPARKLLLKITYSLCKTS